MKNKSFFIFIVILCTTLKVGVLLGAQDVSALIQKALPAVVVVYGQNDTAGSYGSGFFVTTNGDVVTNYHVIEGMNLFFVKSDKGNIYPAQVRAYDKERDIALLATRVPSSEYKVLPLASKIPAIGTAAYAIGAPEGLEKSVSDGLVSQIRKIRDTRYLQVSCPISHGSSGGPILNSNGEVIGVATLFLTIGQNLNFAVPAPTVKTFVEYGKNLDPIDMSIASKPEGATPPSQTITPPASSQKQTPKERYVLLSTMSDFQTYLDTYSIKQDGDIFTFWIINRLNEEASKAYLKKLKTNKKIKNIIINAEYNINMRTKKIKYLQSTSQGGSGEIFYKEQGNTPWESIIPNSPGAKAYDYFLETRN